MIDKTMARFETGNKATSARMGPKSFHKYLSLAILLLAGLFAGRLVWSFPGSRLDFYNELWGPAYLLVHGQSPYDTASLNPEFVAAWFPMAIGSFFPLGLFSEDASKQIWLIANIIQLCAIIYFAQGDQYRTGFSTQFLAILCFVFPPVLNHFSLGQISITVTLCLILATRALPRERHWLAAFLTALAFSKPHLALLGGIGMSSYYYQRGKTNAMFLYWGRVLAAALTLSLPLFVAYPGWIPDAITSMMNNQFWPYPSLFVVFTRHFGSLGYIFWGVTSSITIWVIIRMWKIHSSDYSMYWSLALAPILSPYVGSWDFVVLLPLLTAIFAKTNSFGRGFLILSYVAAWYGMALVQIQENSINYSFWWVPLWFIATILVITTWRAKLIGRVPAVD